jgi:REP element-mobilizing transposase RayT/CheY-like chemotaxis protein
MAKQALILTASKGFGELIRQVLSDASQLEPVLVSSPAKALERAAKGTVDLLVVDTDFDKVNFAEFIAQFRTVAKQSHLLIIPSENKPEDPGLKDLGADVILSKPFYLPDLVAAVEQLYGPLERLEVPKPAYGSAPAKLKIEAAPSHAAPAWLADVSLSAQYLTQLSLESASQAALITRGSKVWAYAGELPQAAAQELAAAVASDADGGTDVARFVHLDATKADYMLYATSLGGEYNLALVFDAQMPFSKMRSQVDKLANALARAPQAQAEAEQAEVAQVKKVTAARMEQGGAVQPRRRLGSFERGGDEPTDSSTSGVVAGVGNVARQTGRLEPLSPGSYDLHYSYVLIPRLPSHRLEGDLADKLALWLSQLCLAFAWRLENMSVHPQFVQWMVSMSPDTSPESVVHTLEKYLSERIFDEFPRLTRENPSGQFFAPGFLIVNGALPPAAMVTEYIQQTRARQGVPNQS